MREKIIAVCYAAGVATEGAITAFASTYAKTKHFWLSVGGGASGLASRGASAYYFQGASILNSASPALPLEPEDISPATSLLVPKGESKETGSSTASNTLQTVYVISDSFNCLLSRYFMFNALFVTFNMNPGQIVFGGVVVLDFVIAQLFALLTGTYASTSKLTGEGAKPVYADLLKPLTGRCARTAVSYVGSFEFVLLNYVTGWIILARSIVNDLTEEEGIRDGVTIAAAIISLGIALVLFCQTYLFDGKYADENLETIDPSAQDLTPRALPQWLLKVTDKTLCIAAPVSGISSGVSVAIGLSQYVANPAKWAIAGSAGLINAVGVWKGAELSQVREARIALDSILKKQNAPTLIGAINGEAGDGGQPRTCQHA